MIKNFFFDFGNVFINLNLEATKNKFIELGLKTLTDKTLEKIYQYEKGLISTNEFTTYFKSIIPNSTTENIEEAWNAILLDFPEYRLEFIEKFCQNKKCFLLSNINELHLNFIKNQLDKTFYDRFISCFDKVYYSHEINLRKPDKAIYEYVLNDNSLKANDCFFVDDKAENIQTAKEMGFKVWLLNPETDDIINIESINL